MQAAFGKFPCNGTASASQIEFIDLVVEQLTGKGFLDPAVIHASPFTDIAPKGPEQVFDNAQVSALFQRFEAFNDSAVA